MNTRALHIDIASFSYNLPEQHIAKFPLPQRDKSKLLVYRGGEICQHRFDLLSGILPQGSMLVFNNTKVIRARIIMHKPSGARIEVFCLEPAAPADYERAFSIQGSCSWHCIVGNSKKWKDGEIVIPYTFKGSEFTLRAFRDSQTKLQNIVRFEWSCGQTFGELLQMLGQMPIPPYLNRKTEDIDITRYQTVYSKFEGSVAAPTAGLHFTDTLIASMRELGFGFEEVTLHVGAGTFLPVKSENATEHPMHTEHFDIRLNSLENIIANLGRIVAVGTTSVRTLESLTALGYRVVQSGNPDNQRCVGQWEIYDTPTNITTETLLVALLNYMKQNAIDTIKASTQIMITPGYRFRVVENIITNFHQPQSTLLLLVSAFVGEDWRKIYDYALSNEFRFLSYGDSSLLFKNE